MNVIQTFTQTFTDIANTIRDKLCISSSEYTFKPSEMYSYISWMHTEQDTIDLIEGKTSIFRDFTLSILNPSNTNWAVIQRLGSRLTTFDCPNVTYAGLNCLFYSCTKLETVNLPNLKSYSAPVSYSTFYNCRSLRYVHITGIDTLYRGMFIQCSNLVSIDLPDVTTLAVAWINIFSSLYNVTTINLPKLSELSYARTSSPFSSNLTTVNFNSLISVPSYFFARCTNLSSISLPNVTSIRYYAFASCSALTTISIPNATYIDGHAFERCINLSSIDLPNVTNIGIYAFGFCTNLSSISLPNVTYIGGNAFYSCINLSSIDLPNVTFINSTCFYNCTNLMSIYLPNSSICRLYVDSSASTPIAFENTTIVDSTYTGSFGSIYVPSSLYGQYISAENWSVFSNRIASM